MGWGIPQRGAVATRTLHERAPRRPTERLLATEEIAWLAAVPTAVVVVVAVLLLGPPLGGVVLPPDDSVFWQGFKFEVRPEPTEEGRYLVSLIAVPVLALLTILGVRRRPRLSPVATDALVTTVQAAALAFAALCLATQKELLGPLYTGQVTPPEIDYFSGATLIAAAAGTLAIAAAVRAARSRALLERLMRESRGRTLAAGAVAVAATVIWLLHAFYTEDTIGAALRDVWFHVYFTYDETLAVLDGRSPLVDYASQYGSLLPYAYAAVMWTVGASLGVWVALCLITTGLGMLAIAALLRRAARSAIGGLLLFLPVLAASFFMVAGTLENRYTFGSYFGTFPMRYAGPSILAWLVVRHLDGLRPTRAWMLFLFAGLVVLNNGDAGIPALGATVVALLCGGGRLTLRRAGSLAASAAAGLAVAFALVSLLTLVRAGALPDLGLLVRFAQMFAAAGFGLFPMPTLGLHLVLYLTYVAALGLATARALSTAPDRALTGMLAWSGTFGLGVGSYFVGRSTPDDLVAMFFPWSLALALLAIPALRCLASARLRRPPIAAAACVFAFLVLACTLAQTPTPWGELERLGRTTPPLLVQPGPERFVAQYGERDEPVLILSLLGHRMGVVTQVENVSPYANIFSMTTAAQLHEAIAALRAAGGRKVFLEPRYTTEDIASELAGAGYRPVTQEASIGLWLDAGPQ